MVSSGGTNDERCSVSRVRKGAPKAEDRDAAKQERVARQQEAARKRKRSVLLRRATKYVVIAVIIAGVGSLFLPGKGRYSAGGSGDAIDGVQFFRNQTGHTLSAVAYPQTPPAGGEHHPTWLNCGIYSEPVPNTNAVHALEHGAVWVTYDPGLSEDTLDALRDHLPSSYVVLSPYVGLGSPIVLTGWNVQLRLSSPDDPRLPRFFEEYWRSQNVPEPGALCTGGIDGPGRSS
jgi:hypothetical protein